MGAVEKISAYIVSLDALSKGLGGVGINAQAVTARITSLYQNFAALSTVTNTTGKEMDALAIRTLQISKQMGYTQESVISMQKTLMVGFQKPIDDLETFNNLLAKSEQLFGRNEDAANRVIETLARQSAAKSSLRDSTLELFNIEGRAAKEGREMNAQELQRTGALRGLNEQILKQKFMNREITREEYFTSLRLISAEKEKQGSVLDSTKVYNENRQKMLASTVAEADAMMSVSGNKIVQKGLEYVTSGGSQLGGKTISSITDLLKGFESTRKAPDNADKSIGSDQQEVLKSFAADVVKNTGAANFAAVQEEIIKKFKEQNILQDLSVEDLKKQVGLLSKSKEVNEVLAANQVRLNGSINDQTGKLEKTVSLEEKRNNTLAMAQALMETMEDNANAQVAALNASIGALSTIGRLSGLSGQSIDASKYGLDPKQIQSGYAAASSAYEELAELAEAENALTKAMVADTSQGAQEIIENGKVLAQSAADSIIQIEARIATGVDDGTRKALEESKRAYQEKADSYKSLSEAAAGGDKKALEDLNSKIDSTGKAGPEGQMKAAKLRQQSTEIELNGQQALIQAVLAGDEQRLKNLDSEFQKIQAEVSLMDSLAVGIGANAAARQQAAQKLIEQVRVVKEEQEKVLALKADYEAREAKAVKGSQEQQIAAAGRQTMQNQYNDLKTKEVNLTKQTLDMTQKLREGYLDAIQAMESGAGVFTEIVVNQDKNLGSLIRTTAEVPRVLRTGAGSGGLTQSTGFGPGGITGGSDPRSEEYGKSVLTNFEQVNQLMAELPKLIGEETGKNLARAASARPEYGGVILDGTSPGSAGTVTVGGSTSPGSADKASPGSADKASPGSASKVQAQAQAEADASKLRQLSIEVNLQGKASPGSADKALAEASAEASAETEKFRQQVIEIRLQDKASNLRQQPEVALNTQQLINQSGKAGSVTVETAAIAETITKGMVAAVEIGVRNALSVLEQKTA